MEDFGERQFQFWEYRVSHGQLLVRSPKGKEETKNIDIVFAGVEYVALPRHLETVELDQATSQEIADLGLLLGKEIQSQQVTILVAKGKRFAVVSAGVRVEENELDLFENPFG